MPKQYCFEIWCEGKPPVKLYKISDSEGLAIQWLMGEGRSRNWGVLDENQTIKSINSRSLSEVYEHTYFWFGSFSGKKYWEYEEFVDER